MLTTSLAMDGILPQSREVQVAHPIPAVYIKVSFRQLCLVTVSLPLCALVVCFITAYIFQPDEIHETHCRVRYLFNNYLFK